MAPRPSADRNKEEQQLTGGNEIQAGQTAQSSQAPASGHSPSHQRSSLGTGHASTGRGRESALGNRAQEQAMLPSSGHF